jgi:HTH-type transcriptional regulator/antitoxin HigA
MQNIRAGNFKMGKLTTIKTEADHAAVLEQIEKLIDADPAPNTPEADRLNLLGLIASDYEARVFPTQVPDAVDAIRFRMEQQDLAPRDLIPYIGSRSKVSEVLSRKRPLTLSMIRALHDRLHIPAKALLQQPELFVPTREEPDWSRFPVRQMIARGWIRDGIAGVREFFAQIPRGVQADLLWRGTVHVRSARKMDPFALKAWIGRVIVEAKKSNPREFKKNSVTKDLLHKVAQMSRNAEGPKEVQNFLLSYGIALVVEPHLPHTYLDGAAILLMKERPIIGMTLRHDRLDNFWFTLMHELAHVRLHLDSEEGQFIDDLDVEAQHDPKEKEADQLAGEILVPSNVWKQSPASRYRSPDAAVHLANQLRVHPAIVAGRMRHHWKAYRLLNHLVGRGQVRPLFKHINWAKLI